MNGNESQPECSLQRKICQQMRKANFVKIALDMHPKQVKELTDLDSVLVLTIGKVCHNRTITANELKHQEGVIIRVLKFGRTEKSFVFHLLIEQELFYGL